MRRELRIDCVCMSVVSRLGGTHERAVKSVTEQKDGSVATRGEKRGREREREEEGRKGEETENRLRRCLRRTRKKCKATNKSKRIKEENERGNEGIK